MTINKFLMTSALALTTFMGVASAQTVAVETREETIEVEGVNQVQFSKFDVNGDGQYSMEEVGETLFYMFDTDGNEVIDNLEWDNKNVMTIIPIEREQFTYIDADSDGEAEMTSHTYESFYKESGLMAFDENKDGLSAEEFIAEGFEVLDTDQNKVISLEEWENVYLESRLKHNKPENYNNGQKG